MVSGARQKVEDWEPEDSEVIRLKGKSATKTSTLLVAMDWLTDSKSDSDEALMEKLENDAFFKLEHGVKDEKKASETVPVLTRLQKLNEAQWSDPYSQSQQLRRKFREQKKLDMATFDKKEKLREKLSLHIDLVDESPQDDIQAKLTVFAGKKSQVKQTVQLSSTVFNTLT